METQRYRRNTVVLYETMYGRISRVLPDMMYEVYDCGKYCTIVHHDKLIADGYKGIERSERYTGGRVREYFSHMPTLRRLKKMRGRYYPVFQKRPRLEKTLPRIDYDQAEKLLYALIDFEIDTYGIGSPRRIFKYFEGERLYEHNVYRHYVKDDMLATRFYAKWKPHTIRGHNWILFIDQVNQEAVAKGNLEEVEAQLFLNTLARP